MHSLTRHAKSNHTKRLLEQSSNDATSFWKALKRVYLSKNKIFHVEIPIMLCRGSVNNLVVSIKQQTNQSLPMHRICIEKS